MADWTDITNASVQPKAPVTSELVTALRDNPIAIAEGASGATRLLGLAIADFSEVPPITVSAANTYTLGEHNIITVGTLTGSTPGLFVTARTIEIQAVTGTVRFKATQTVNDTPSTSPDAVSEIDLKKNGSTVVTWSLGAPTDGLDFTNRSSDISVVPGDIITWEHRVTGVGSSVLSSLSETADNEYTRLGLLIARSDL